MKKLFSFLLGLCLISNVCFANLFYSPEWSLDEKSNGVFYSNDNFVEYGMLDGHKTVTVLYGLYGGDSPRNKENADGFHYCIFKATYHDDENPRVTFGESYFYDQNGDLRWVNPEEHEEAMDLDVWKQSREDAFGGKEIQSRKIVDGGFFIHPAFWEYVGIVGDVDKPVLALFDRRSVRTVKKYGKEHIEAWVCYVRQNDKDYVKQYILFSKEDRTTQDYDLVVYNFKSHDSKLVSSGHGKETRIVPGSILDDIFKSVVDYAERKKL